MKKKLLIIVPVLLVLVLAVFWFVYKDRGSTPGGENGEQGESVFAGEISKENLKIGVLCPDDVNGASASHYLKEGVLKAAEKLGLDMDTQIIITPNARNVDFDEDFDFSEALDSHKERAAAEDAGDTSGTTVTADLPPTAASSVFEMVSQGCNVIVATSTIYDDLTAYLAKQLPKVAFLQYGKPRGGEELPNRQYFYGKLYEGFYLAGIAAGKLTVKGNIGFLSDVNSPENGESSGAFLSGARSVNSASSVHYSALGTAFDLILETRMAEAAINESDCDVIAQSLRTALPLVAAENAKVYCFGFGYDMSGDAKTKCVFSVLIDYSVYFESALGKLTSGEFSGESYASGLKEGLVGISEFRVDKAGIADEVNAARDKIISGELDPLANLTFGADGFAEGLYRR